MVALPLQTDSIVAAIPVERQQNLDEVCNAVVRPQFTGTGGYKFRGGGSGRQGGRARSRRAKPSVSGQAPPVKQDTYHIHHERQSDHRCRLEQSRLEGRHAGDMKYYMAKPRPTSPEHSPRPLTTTIIFYLIWKFEDQFVLTKRTNISRTSGETVALSYFSRPALIQEGGATSTWKPAAPE